MESTSINKEETELGQESIDTIKGGDVISMCRLLDVSRCPPIPLCRMHSYPKVRGMRTNISLLKDALEGAEYCPEKGTFIVSVVNEVGIEIPITDEIRASWDQQWVAVDQEFESELGFRSLSQMRLEPVGINIGWLWIKSLRVR